MKKRLLFVCLGNICRSPAAEGIMKQLVEERGLADQFHIESAAIGPWHIGDLTRQSDATLWLQARI